MSKRPSVYDRPSNVTPAAMRGVAERRFADATALSRIGKNKHANGVVYLAGYVIEILLKAMLLEVYGNGEDLG